jgi:RING-type zinc-finger/B-box zinc finger
MDPTSSAVREQLNDITECSICHDTFRDPRTLPCLHTFCFECLETYAKGKRPGEIIECPLCRKKHTIPERGLADLPKNFFIGKLLQIKELSNVSAEDKKFHCELCCSDVNEDECAPATMYCVDCQERLCDGCANIHRRQKATRTHTCIKPGDNFAATSYHVKSLTTFCGTHKSKQIELFCEQCDVTICVICYVEQHNTHKCSDVDNVATDFRQLLKADAMNLADVAQKHTADLKKVEEEKLHFMGCLDKIEGEVCTRVEQLKELIDSQKQTILTKIETIRQERIKQVKNTVSEIDGHISIVDSFKRYLDEMSQKGASVDVASEKGRLHNKATELSNCDAVQKTIEELGTVTVTFTSSRILTDISDNAIGQLDTSVSKRGLLLI